MADVAFGTAITPSTIFRLGSITKTFTAIAVLQLAEEGKLKLADPLSRFLPGHPEGDRILISHLLSHTSGIADFIPIEVAMKQPLESEPGARINYSNTGYNILGKILEGVSGKPWEDVLRERIFAPLGMTRTGYDRTDKLEGRATAYLLGPEGKYLPIQAGDARGAYASGGLYSTLDDMILFESALHSGKLLPPAALERARTPYTLSDGRRTVYGYGWMCNPHSGVRRVGHGGDITGFNSYFADYPEDRLSVIVLSNTGMRPPGPITEAGKLSEQIAALWLGDRLKPPPPAPAIQFDSRTLDSFAGRYRLKAPQAIINNMGAEILIVRAQSGLAASVKGAEIPLNALSPVSFQAPGSPVALTFACSPPRPCARIVVSLMGVREYEAVRIDQ